MILFKKNYYLKLRTNSELLVDVDVLGGLPLNDLLRAEPEGNLAGSGSLVGVRSVDDVAENNN